MHTLHDLENICPDTDQPVLLFQENGHSIYWLGIAKKTAFRCNTYLIEDSSDMDFVGRYGGEELCCILPETDLDGAIKVAEKIAAHIKDRAMPHADSPVADRVTVSMGVAAWQPDAPVSPEELLALADDYLYAAKRKGRNRIVSEIKKDKH